MREPTLSLCMIVRNEEACLDACLASAAPAVDEIIIVDTGSTDATPAIAEKHGAKVIHHAWADDFSDARNVSLEHATSDWILVLDADETLDPAGIETIREAIRNPRIASYQLPIVNLYNDEKTVVSLITRMFRNDPSIRFRNVIHEQVTDSLAVYSREHGLEFGILRANVIHTGYHPVIVESRKKDDRNLRLFQKQLEQFPDDLYSHYKYADFLRRYPDEGPARDAFAEAYRRLYEGRAKPREDLVFAGEIFAFHALYRYRAGDLAEADRIARQGLEDLASATPNLLHVSAQLAMELGEMERAEGLLKRCLSMDGMALAIPGQPGITSYRTMTELARVLLATQRKAEAWTWFDRAMHSAGGESTIPVLTLGHALCSEGRPAEALQCLSIYMRQFGETPALALATGRTLLEVGNPAAAEKWFKRCLESRDTATEARAMLARARLFQGELRISESDWNALPDSTEKACAQRLIRLVRSEPVDRAVRFDDPEESRITRVLLRGLESQGHREIVQAFDRAQRALSPETPDLDSLLHGGPPATSAPPQTTPRPASDATDSSTDSPASPTPGTLREPATPVATTAPAATTAEEPPSPGDWIARIERPFARLFDEGAAILDVNPCDGRFLAALAAEGRSGVGLARDAAQADALRRLGFEVREGGLETIASFDGTLDGIHAARVIETLAGEDARRFLASAAAALRPGGVLVLRTRNWNDTAMREGAFWLDPDTVRPYPLELLETLARELGLAVERRGEDAFGSHDVYLVVRRATTATSTPIAPADDVPRVVWEGEFFTPQSFARINREITSHWMRDARCEVSLLALDTELPVTPAHDDDALLGAVHAPLRDRAEFHIRHTWPANFEPPAQGRWIQIQPYEFGRVPEAWIAPIADRVDEIWVPSHYARRCYTASGVAEDRVAVVPNGVDTSRFRPDVVPLELPTQKPFRFLFVGGSIWRKGIDVLLETWRRTFRRDDPVTLVIKDACQDTFYKDRHAADSIRRLAEDPDAPEIVYLEAPLDEDDMPRLYAACDALVHPYRGEGFGLPIIEAMACGKPVILTSGGACDELAPENTIFPVRAERLPIQPAGLVLAGSGWVLEPDAESLAQAMRTAYERRAELPAMGARARQHVEDRFSWERAADLAYRRLTALRQRPPRRTTRTVETPGAHAEPLERIAQRMMLADPAGALEIVRSEAVHRPDDPILDQWSGIAYRASGDLANARTAFERALRSDPNFPEAWYHLGLVAVSEGNSTAGLEALERAHELGLEDAALFNDLGVLYLDAGDAERAERSIRQALEAAPNDPDAVYNLGMLWMRRGRNDDVRAWAESVLASDPANPGARSLLDESAAAHSE